MYDALQRRPRVPWLLVGGPAVFLLLFFVFPTALHLSISFLRSDIGILTSEPTLDNYTRFFGSEFYRTVLLRTFIIGASVGLLVVILAFPVAYFLTRTNSRWQGTLIALCFAPLLASVIVRTYGWHTILGTEGIINLALIWLGIIDAPIRLIPSVTGIVIGLTHVLLPYGVLIILGSLKGLNPNLELASMSLGANRTKTFFLVMLPLSIPGVAGTFFLSFAITLSAYATPAILGGPRTETMATMIYSFMLGVMDWSMGSTVGTILVVTALALMFTAARLGAKRGAL